MRRTALAALAAAWLAAVPLPQLPNEPGSLKFAVIGDNGTGSRQQHEVAAQMELARRRVPYELVLMMGDNFYGGQSPAELRRKFDEPYRALLEAGVTFQAALGNHDALHTIEYPPLNMRGRRDYTFTRAGVRFVVLDTNDLDDPQLAWAEGILREAREPWKIAYFHHPIYGNAGRHGANVDLRVRVEPLLVKHGVQVVLSGHDHVYERLRPQKGIHYFVVGSSGQLRRGNLAPSDSTAAGFDQDQAFMLVEMAGDALHFQVISRRGLTVDSGEIRRAARGTDH